MPGRLIESLATTEALAELFSDESVLRAMLQFEVALARAEAKLDIIPRTAAEVIAKAAAHVEAFNVPALVSDTLRAGTPGIPLAKALREAVRAHDAKAADYVHFVATSQDVADSAIVLLLKRSLQLIEADIARAERALRRLAERHRGTVMLARTLLQPAPPVTFGLKAAGWYATIRRSRRRLAEAFSDALVLQFGGASGTLAALGQRGAVVAQALADELGLVCPDAPWHTHRDRMAALICACGVLTGSLGKIARDISLLMQSEVEELAEAASEGRGGSSTMPHKQNPIGCAVILATAERVPGLVSSYLAAMVQEHERALGGWQSEWPVIAGIIQSTGVAAASMAEVSEGLEVNATRMAANIDATLGTIFAEKAMLLLSEKMGRTAAQELLERASRTALSEHKSLAAVLGDMPSVAQNLTPTTLHQLEAPQEYLGMAGTFQTALLASNDREQED